MKKKPIVTESTKNRLQRLAGLTSNVITENPNTSINEGAEGSIVGIADDLAKGYIKDAMHQAGGMFGDDEELFAVFVKELTKAISRHGYDYIGDMFDTTAGAAPDEME